MPETCPSHDVIICWEKIDGLMHDCSVFIANALEIWQSCHNSSSKCGSCYHFAENANSLAPDVTIWSYIFWAKLIWISDNCLTAPSHCLNYCRLSINEINNVPVRAVLWDALMTSIIKWALISEFLSHSLIHLCAKLNIYITSTPTPMLYPSPRPLTSSLGEFRHLGMLISNMRHREWTATWTIISTWLLIFHHCHQLLSMPSFPLADDAYRHMDSSKFIFHLFAMWF